MPSPPPSSGCGEPLKLTDPAAGESAMQAVGRLSAATQNYILACRCTTPDCVADALDEYARALAVVAPRLPKALRNAPRIVAEAAHKARVAKTTAVAVKALDRAIAVVHKEIALVRSEDPATEDSGRRTGQMVADTLQVASDALVNSGGL